MASTNKTQNLALNQWVLTDPFLMEDMNADNVKIDAAVQELREKSPFVKLKSIITTAGGISQIDMDVSDINFDEWQYVLVDTKLGIGCNVRVNNNSNGYGNSFVGFMYTQAQQGTIGVAQGNCRLTFMPCLGLTGTVSVVAIGGGSFTSGTSSYVSFSSLSSINFVAGGSQTFSSGREVTIWGIR